MTNFCVTAVVSFFLSTFAMAADPLFSGPQVGEALVPFQAQTAFGGGEKINVLDDIQGSPTLLLFVHQITRPSIGVIRLLMNYAATKENEGLKSRLVFLSDDPTETEAFLRRARHALPPGVTPLISTDGIEGPGAYGLNRKMTLTVLVGTKGKVTANFPLLQPSLQADATRIGHAMVKALGGEQAPTLNEMGFEEPPRAMRKAGQQGDSEATYRRLMSPVIQKTATPAEVAKAAKNVERFAAKNPWFKDRVYHAASKIVGSGKLSNYGTAEAQEVLKKWAKEYAPTKEKPADQAEGSTGQAEGTTGQVEGTQGADIQEGDAAAKADSE